MRPIEYYFVNRYERGSLFTHLFLGISALLIGFYCSTLSLQSMGDTIVGIFQLVTIGYFLAGIFILLKGFFFNTIQVSGIVDDEPIFSMRNRLDQEGSVSGAFFLGTGFISDSSDEQEYYVYYKKGTYGLIKDKIAVEDVEVIMTNKYKPSKKEILIDGEEKTFLFVPKNTIKKRIELTT